VKALRSHFDEVTGAAGRTAHASGGVTRELIVLGHEAMMGNFSRFGGSLIVMAELMGNVGVKTIAAGGAIALAGVAAYHLLQNLREAAREADALNAKTALMGRDPEEVTAAAKALAKQLQTDHDVGTAAARGIAAEFLTAKGATIDMARQLALLVPALQVIMHDKSIDEVGQALVKVSSSFRGIKNFMDENDLFANAQQREALENLTDQGKLTEAQAMLVDRVNTRWGTQFAQIEKSKKAVADLYKTAEQSGLAVVLKTDPVPDVPKPKLTEPAESPEDAHLDEAQLALTKSKRELADVDRTIIGLEQRLGATTEETQKANIRDAITAAKAKRDEMAAAGDTGWLAKQERALAQQDGAIEKSAQTLKASTEGKLQNDVAYWTRVTAGTDLSVSQREVAERRLLAAQVALHADELRVKEQADRAGVSSARRSVQEQMADLSAQQAANRDDFTRWMALEQQKLSILRTAYGEKSKAFLDELKAEETYQREHNARMQAVELEGIDRQNSTAQRALAQRISEMQTEVAEGVRTKGEELGAARDMTVAEGALEIQRLDKFIGNLTDGTDEFRKAMEKRADLYQNFQSRLAAIDTRIAEEDRRATDRSLAIYTSAFDRIGSTGENMFTGLVSGTTTWQRAELQAAQSVMQSLVSVAGHALASWTATEIGKTLTTVTQARIRSAQENGASGLAVLGRSLAQWAGFESAKTATTTAHAAVRSTADSGGSFLSAIGSMLAGWFGLETAKSGATTAGATERTIAETAADAVVVNAAGATDRLLIAGAAAVAAANAFALGSLGGPEIAGPAAAAAYGETMAFQAAVPALAVGAWNVPRDMLAQIHQGEMVVPANFASGLRDGASIGAGGDVHVHIHANDAASFMAQIRSVGPQIASVVSRHMSRNPSARPAY
jgi:hypothetical protein